MTNAVAAIVVLAFVAALAYLQRKASKAEALARDAEQQRRYAIEAKRQAEHRANIAEQVAFRNEPYANRRLSDAERTALVDSVREKIRGSHAGAYTVRRKSTADDTKSK